MDWTRGTLRDIFGTLDGDGLRRYRDVYLEVPKKNTKTTFCAGLVVFYIATSKTTGTEVYSAATAKDQAGIVFRAAAQMVNASRPLSEKLQIIPSTKRIVRRDDPSSFYCAISADGDIHDGINPQFVVRDELHRWRTRKALELNEVLERGMIARAEPLIVDITTAGEVDESPLCWRRHEYARQINEGVFEDRRFYGRIWAADSKRIDSDTEYWKSREARVTANPSHEENGGYLKDSVLQDLCTKAQNDPQAKAEYLRYHLNIWGQRDECVIDRAKWEECGGGVDLRTWPEYDVDLLIQKWGLLERPCWAGVDASWTTDLTSLSLVFPPIDDNSPWSILPFFWMPAERVTERERRDKVPYRMWTARGWIEATAGNAVDQRVLLDKIRWASRMFSLQEVDFDPWNFRTAATELVDEGFQCIEVRQGYASLGEATKKLLEFYVDGKIRHGNHPVLNWNASCLSLQSDRKDNVQPAKPERAKSSKRIDGIAATITALARAVLAQDQSMSFFSVG